MGVFLNKAIDDGSVVALWQITESVGKSLSEQRLAVDALIDTVFEGKERLCHGEDGVPFLEVADDTKTAGGVEPSNRDVIAGSVPEKGEPSVPFVSVSHTKGWAAIMTNPKEHVGIDIELSDRDFSAVGKKALCPAELERLDDWAEVLRDSLPSDTDNVTSDVDTDPSETASEENSSKTSHALSPWNTVLGLLWCAKEAVYKRLTVPATDFANQIEIESIIPTSTDKGKIMAIFKYEDSETIKICLEYYIISGLLLVYTK